MPTDLSVPDSLPIMNRVSFVSEIFQHDLSLNRSCRKAEGLYNFSVFLYVNFEVPSNFIMGSSTNKAHILAWFDN